MTVGEPAAITPGRRKQGITRYFLFARHPPTAMRTASALLYPPIMIILRSHHLKIAGLLVFRLDILLESEAGAT